MAGPSPLLGYNTNVRHKGKLYHIQTEDSGVKRPHIITHLFADGGRIVASKKTSYKDIVETGGYQDRVKQMMRDQHKAMFIGLRDGEFDEPEHAEASAHGLLKAPTLSPPPPEEKAPEPAVDQFEAAAARLSAGSISQASQPASQAPVSQAPVSQAPVSQASPEAAAKTTLKDSRYEPTRAARPATAPAPPAKAPDSIFGDNLLSEKSLDEVILSYLAEDLDESG